MPRYERRNEWKPLPHRSLPADMVYGGLSRLLVGSRAVLVASVWLLLCWRRHARGVGRGASHMTSSRALFFVRSVPNPVRQRQVRKGSVVMVAAPDCKSGGPCASWRFESSPFHQVRAVVQSAVLGRRTPGLIPADGREIGDRQLVEEHPERMLRWLEQSEIPRRDLPGPAK